MGSVIELISGPPMPLTYPSNLTSLAEGRQGALIEITVPMSNPFPRDICIVPGPRAFLRVPMILCNSATAVKDFMDSRNVVPFNARTVRLS